MVNTQLASWTLNQLRINIFLGYGNSDLSENIDIFKEIEI